VDAWKLLILAGLLSCSCHRCDPIFTQEINGRPRKALLWEHLLSNWMKLTWHVCSCWQNLMEWKPLLVCLCLLLPGTVLFEVHVVVHDTCSFFLCQPHFSKCSLGQSMGCNVFLQSAWFVGCGTPTTRAARQDAFVWFSLYVWTVWDSPSALTEGRIFPSLQLLLDLMRTCHRISTSCLVWRQSRDGFTGLWEIDSKSQGPVS